MVPHTTTTYHLGSNQRVARVGQGRGDCPFVQPPAVAVIHWHHGLPTEPTDRRTIPAKGNLGNREANRSLSGELAARP